MLELVSRGVIDGCEAFGEPAFVEQEPPVGLGQDVAFHEQVTQDRAAKRLAADGFPVADNLLARLSPLQFDHINFLAGTRSSARPGPGSGRCANHRSVTMRASYRFCTDGRTRWGPKTIRDGRGFEPRLVGRSHRTGRVASPDVQP
ncbi:hypothetical protein [Kitasatospora camelliae]|uniref:Tn3 transposase DDE domain-containing protein n=1 Tax=Kitasatospora camelliae TaxID=3156397 RepID=A0AAU8K8H5_9ACTN